MSLSNIKVNNSTIIGVDDEPIVNSQNLVTSGGVASHTNMLIYTDNANVNLGIKEIYWDVIPSDRGYYLNNFGFYAQNNWFYGQLRDSNGNLVGQSWYDFDSFDGHFIVGNIHVIVDKSVFTR